MGPRVRVYITVGSKTSTVKFAYNEEIIEVVRGFVGRQWDAKSRVWIIYNHDVPKLEAELKKMGHTVHYTSPQDARSEDRRQRGSEYQQRQRRTYQEDSDSDPFSDFNERFARDEQQRQQRQQNYTRDRSAGRPRTTPETEREWAVLLFRKVGKKRARAVYRALVKVLHQDVPDDGEGGGDKDLIQQLNDAYEPWKKM